MHHVIDLLTVYVNSNSNYAKSHNKFEDALYAINNQKTEAEQEITPYCHKYNKKITQNIIF
jgi:hypothetical protein